MTGNLERLLSVEKEKERLPSGTRDCSRSANAALSESYASYSRIALTVQCEPARMVSGDYYDYESVRSNTLAFAIGDVAGKGISAALLMATVQAALRAQISGCIENMSQMDAAKLVSELNKQLHAHTAPEKYTTFFFGMFDKTTGALTYTNAGHLPPILLRNGEATMLDVNGTVVGAFPFPRYNESTIVLEPGDLLICYTDGITEPENAYGEMFGEERLIETIKRAGTNDDALIIRKIIDAVQLAFRV